MAELTIATFNVHGGILTSGISVPRLWRSQKPLSPNGSYDMAGTLGALDADVLVLQETWWPDAEPAAVYGIAASKKATVHEAIFGRGTCEPFPRITYRHGQDAGSFGLAVVSRVPAKALGKLPVGRVPADPAKERCALHLELDVDGTAVDLVGLHLSSRLPYGPPIQLQRLRRQLPRPGRPAILVGDFNFWGPAVSGMLPGWRRAVRGRTWPAHRPHSQIDHVFVRGDVEVIEGAILDDVGSDHRPVRVRLRVG